MKEGQGALKEKGVPRKLSPLSRRVLKPTPRRLSPTSRTTTSTWRVNGPDGMYVFYPMNLRAITDHTRVVLMNIARDGTHLSSLSGSMAHEMKVLSGSDVLGFFSACHLLHWP